MSSACFIINRINCVKLLFFFFKHQSVLIPTFACFYILRGILCFALTVARRLPESGFFGKPEPTNQLFVVAVVGQSALSLCPVWAGLLLCFYNTYPPQPLALSLSLQGWVGVVDGVGVGGLVAALCQCVYVYTACIRSS